METRRRTALVARLAGLDPVVEVAVGRRPAVAAALADRGATVTATDRTDRPVPDGVTFRRDDLTDPDLSIYTGAAALYARHLPAELQRPAADVSRQVGAPLFFTTLGTETPVIPVDQEPLADGTLYRAEPERA